MSDVQKGMREMAIRKIGKKAYEQSVLRAVWDRGRLGIPPPGTPRGTNYVTKRRKRRKGVKYQARRQGTRGRAGVKSRAGRSKPSRRVSKRKKSTGRKRLTRY